MQAGMKITAEDIFFKDLDRCGVNSPYASEISKVSLLLQGNFSVDHISYHAELLPEYRAQGGFLFVLAKPTLDDLAVIPVPYGFVSKDFVLAHCPGRLYFRKDLSFPSRIGKSLEELQDKYPLLLNL